MSAGIEFVPHQIAAVRRVLKDPVPRYLLADEVGLGKTIEAGLIIRQNFIDRPNQRVLVVAPDHLVEQWRRELAEKIRLDQFPNAVECCSFSDYGSDVDPPEILVVDEAHHLAGAEGDRGEALRRHGEAASVLLLLSATPPVRDEERFLALLNLLDPAAHPITDLQGFRTKMALSREIGRILLSLEPETSGLVLRRRAEELLRLFPDDDQITRLAPALIAATREDPDQLDGLCADLAGHIAWRNPAPVPPKQ